MRTVWSVLLSLYSPFYFCDNKYWYDITGVVVCMPGTRKSNFFILASNSHATLWDFDDSCGSFFAQNILILSAYCSYCSPKDFEAAFPFPPHQKLPLQLLLGNENSLFITFFWIFCWVNSLEEKINKKHHKTTNITKQINKTNKPESWEAVNEEPLLRNNNEAKLPAKSLIYPLFHDTVLPCLFWGFHEEFSYGVLKNLLSSDGLLEINGGWTPLSQIPSHSGLWFAEDLPWGWGWSLLIPC